MNCSGVMLSLLFSSRESLLMRTSELRVALYGAEWVNFLNLVVSFSSVHFLQLIFSYHN